MMSRKNVLNPFRHIVAQSMGADVTSLETDVGHLDNIVIDLRWTGTPTGTFLVEYTLDDANWEALDFGSSVAAAGAAGDHQLFINQFPGKRIRTRYVRSSGTGTLNGWIMAKMAGG
jgi:hypothetical protein